MGGRFVVYEQTERVQRNLSEDHAILRNEAGSQLVSAHGLLLPDLAEFPGAV